MQFPQETLDRMLGQDDARSATGAASGPLEFPREWEDLRFHGEPVYLRGGRGVSAQEVLNRALNESESTVANIWVVLPSGQRAPMCVKRDEKQRMEIALFYDKYDEDGNVANDRSQIVRALKHALVVKSDRFSMRREVRALPKSADETSAESQRRYLHTLGNRIDSGVYRDFRDALAEKKRAKIKANPPLIQRGTNPFDMTREERCRSAAARSTQRPLKVITLSVGADPSQRANALLTGRPSRPEPRQ